MTRVRLVQFQRNTDEPMGITLKLNEEGKQTTSSLQQFCKIELRNSTECSRIKFKLYSAMLMEHAVIFLGQKYEISHLCYCICVFCYPFYEYKTFL